MSEKGTINKRKLPPKPGILMDPFTIKVKADILNTL